MRTPDSDLASSWSAKATSAISSVPRIAPTAAPDHEQHAQPGGAHRRRAVAVLVPARRRLGPALGGEQQAADGGEGEGGDDAAGRVPGRRQERDEHRADDEDELVDDRLHRQRRRQAVAAAQQVGPADPDHRGDRRDAGAGHARRRAKTIHSRPVAPSRRRGTPAPDDDEDGEHGQQHPPLAVAVGQPAEHRAGQRGGDRAGRGDRAAEAVGARSPTATSSTQPRPTIDSGSRPMNAASTIGRACGVRSTCR